MLHFLLLFVSITTVCSSGDHSHDAPDTNEATAEDSFDSVLSFESEIKDDAITLTVTFQGTSGWFAVGVSADGMMVSNGVGSDAVVCRDDGDVQRYWMTSKQAPSGGTPVDGSTCEFSDGKGVLKFSRTLAASNDKELEILAKGNTKMIYAHSTAKWPMHHSARGSKDIDFGANPSGAAQPTVAYLLLVVCFLVTLQQYAY